jgi:hypothetical protein
MSQKQIKDKCIALKGPSGSIFLAVVEYYQDRPSRDEHAVVEQEFPDMKSAQKFLEKFPRDVWDGTAHVGRKQPLM